METRKFWLDSLLKIADPVLHALDAGVLKQRLPVFHPGRQAYAPLEAFGRLLCGIAPWLNCTECTGEEEALRQHYLSLTARCIGRAADPASPDFMGWGETGPQALVDAAFLSHALVRAPELVRILPQNTKAHLTAALQTTRAITPGEGNWLFFSAMVETALYRLGAPDWDALRIAFAVRRFYTDWYKGDGVYGDGPAFHWDYYNSFVIQPMLVDIVRTFREQDPYYAGIYPEVLRRAARYATVLERFISPEGTYPVIGRSITYRFGAFQLLAQAALEHFLDPQLPPAQVRCALTAVLRKTLAAPGLFDADGWLRPGVYGDQPELAEDYISVGSLYLCAAVFLPLGLPVEDAFWSGADVPWTALRCFRGEPVPIDHCI